MRHTGDFNSSNQFQKKRGVEVGIKICLVQKYGTSSQGKFKAKKKDEAHKLKGIPRAVDGLPSRSQQF